MAVRQHERHALALGHIELGDTREIPALERDRRAHRHPARPRHRAQPGSVLELRHPRQVVP